MTNEEYIQSSCDRCYKQECLGTCQFRQEQASECDCPTLELVGRALRMKDQQFREYLAKKLEVVKDKLSKTYVWDESGEFIKLRGQMIMLDEIINELFKED